MPVKEIVFEPRGAARKLFTSGESGRIEQILLSGPAGTGKSRACLEWMHLNACRFPNSRQLMLRKTRVSLTASGMVTMKEKVIQPEDDVRFVNSSGDEPAQFRYPNGSVINVGGLDKASKIMSTEYDIIFIQEATECNENDWESALTRLRNAKMPFHQLLADCNPDAPWHWLKQRCDSGKTLMLHSWHEDNPTVTEEYLKTLDTLTGHRYQRLRLGKWASAEGIIYEQYDPRLHVIPRFEIPKHWKRLWSIDFGFTNPFSLLCWALDEDGRLYLYRQIYRTQTLVEDHARLILSQVGHHDSREDGFRWTEPQPAAIVCDHDAEGRATFARAIGLRTTAAKKDVLDGIEAVKLRLRPAGDGKPRLFILEDSLLEEDALLKAEAKPCKIEQEFESYVWDLSNNAKRGEQPLKRYDHAMDGLRYIVAYLDLTNKPKHRIAPIAIGKTNSFRSYGVAT